MAWALEQQLVTDAPARHVLLCLANYADNIGRGAFPAAQTLSEDTGLSERTIRTKLDVLESQGLIKRGNQALAATYIDRVDRRPVCYDLCLERGASLAPRYQSRGASDDTNGVQLTTERGAGAAPNTSVNRQKEIQKNTRTDGAVPDDHPLWANVNPQVRDDFKRLRKKHRAEITLTALKGIAKEAQKAGWTMEQTLEYVVTKGWRSFDASWLNREKGWFGSNPQQRPNAQPMHLPELTSDD